MNKSGRPGQGRRSTPGSLALIAVRQLKPCVFLTQSLADKKKALADYADSADKKRCETVIPDPRTLVVVLALIRNLCTRHDKIIACIILTKILKQVQDDGLLNSGWRYR